MQNDMQEKHDHSESCGHCKECCCSHEHSFGGHSPSHWIIKIIILAIVFWLGVQFGEIGSYQRFGGPMMSGYGSGSYYGPGPGMMYYDGGYAPGDQVPANAYNYRTGGTSSAPLQ